MGFKAAVLAVSVVGEGLVGSGAFASAMIASTHSSSVLLCSKRCALSLCGLTGAPLPAITAKRKVPVGSPSMKFVSACSSVIPAFGLSRRMFFRNRAYRSGSSFCNRPMKSAFASPGTFILDLQSIGSLPPPLEFFLIREEMFLRGVVRDPSLVIAAMELAGGQRIDRELQQIFRLSHMSASFYKRFA
jgi:hypothetical protein